MDSSGGYMSLQACQSHRNIQLQRLHLIIFNLYFNEVDLKLIQLTLQHFSRSPNFHLFLCAITHARRWLEWRKHSQETSVPSVYHWDLHGSFNGLFFSACSVLELCDLQNLTTNT